MLVMSYEKWILVLSLAVLKQQQWKKILSRKMKFGFKEKCHIFTLQLFLLIEHATGKFMHNLHSRIQIEVEPWIVTFTGQEK